MGRVGTGALPLQNPGFPENETALLFKGDLGGSDLGCNHAA